MNVLCIHIDGIILYERNWRIELAPFCRLAMQQSGLVRGVNDKKNKQKLEKVGRNQS